MAGVKELTEITNEVLNTAWDVRDGQVVPETEDIKLKNGAVKLDATFLYADLAGSSTLAKLCPWETTAKIIRAYLECSTRLIRAYGGHIRSFDGDRVMGVFIGDRKNTSAANCAREIFYVVEKIIGPAAVDKFKSVKDNGIKLKHCVGIDTGIARAVRAGIRDSNDLIWVGKAPSFAAKLSDVRTYPHSVYISSRSYKVMTDAAKKEGDTNIWEAADFTFLGEKETVYRTKFLKTP